jgi:hypothetical protein
MTYDFAPLRQALKHCADEGMAVPLWWRDDDAVAPTGHLDRLLALSQDVSMPLHLAVIPAFAEDALAERLDGTDVTVLVHGWAHANHAPPSEKKAEFGHARADAARELKQGLHVVKTRFGARLTPVFVPPWNRISKPHAALLPTLGYRGLSTFGPRADETSINTHIDPIEWRGTRDLVDTEHLIARTVELLENRLKGKEDRAEPLGLLTHHLVHTDAIWASSAAWLQEMLQGGAIPTDPKGVLP